MIQGRYFSEGTEVSEATLHRQGNQVMIHSSQEGQPGALASISVEAVMVSEQLAGVPRRLTIGGLGSFETRDDDAVNALFEINDVGSWISRLERSSTAVWWSVGGLISFAILLYLVILPALASVVASATPLSVRRLLDQSSINSLETFQVIEESTLPKEQLQTLTPLQAELIEQSGLPELNFKVVDSVIGPNALAFPGGTVLITSDLVKLATLDELRAVLYHEVGHVVHQHGMKMVVERAGVSLFLLALFGFDDLNAIPQLLLTSSYSREAERESDHYAAEALKRNGQSPMLLASILKKMMKSAQKDQEGPSKEKTQLDLFSSHPLTSERIQYLSADER